MPVWQLIVLPLGYLCVLGGAIRAAIWAADNWLEQNE